MHLPDWFTALSWSTPIRIEDLRASRTSIPKQSGVYVFTKYDGPLIRNTGVLYVGKAKSLHSRVQSYLADPANVRVLSRRATQPRVSSTLAHPGKVQLLAEVQQHMRGASPGTSGIWVRWHTVASPEVLEDLLIKALQPAFNTMLR